jgi:hypothetical protein
MSRIVYYASKHPISARIEPARWASSQLSSATAVAIDKSVHDATLSKIASFWFEPFSRCPRRKLNHQAPATFDSSGSRGKHLGSSSSERLLVCRAHGMRRHISCLQICRYETWRLGTAALRSVRYESEAIAIRSGPFWSRSFSTLSCNFTSQKMLSLSLNSTGARSSCNSIR